MIILEVFTLVSQFLSHILNNNRASKHLSKELVNIFSFTAMKLACKNDGGGGSQGCVQVASADFCRMRGIEADRSQLRPGPREEHLTSQLSWVAA